MLVSCRENDLIYDVNGSMSFHPSVICWHCILIAFKTVYLILTRGIFVNHDCNLQTVEAKPATGIDVGGSAKQTTC